MPKANYYRGSPDYLIVIWLSTITTWRSLKNLDLLITQQFTLLYPMLGAPRGPPGAPPGMSPGPPRGPGTPGNFI